MPRSHLECGIQHGLKVVALTLLTASWAAADPLYNVVDFGPAAVTDATDPSTPRDPGDTLSGNRITIDDAGQLTVAAWPHTGSAYTGPLPAELDSTNPLARDVAVFSQAGGNLAGYGIETISGRYWRGFAVIDGVAQGFGDPNKPSQAFGINQSGQVVGWTIDSGSFLYTPGSGLHPLVGMQGYAINNAGTIVGEAGGFTGASTLHGFLSHNGQAPIDLNSLIPSSSGWTIVSATGINNDGQIAAFGVDAKGQTHALRLDPIDSTAVPEPSGLAVFSLATVGLLLRRRASSPE